ncbi:hypothetical protein BDV19DRAFT_366220 [Aspergillus venezuelensis]
MEAGPFPCHLAHHHRDWSTDPALPCIIPSCEHRHPHVQASCREGFKRCATLCLTPSSFSKLRPWAQRHATTAARLGLRIPLEPISYTRYTTMIGPSNECLCMVRNLVRESTGTDFYRSSYDHDRILLASFCMLANAYSLRQTKQMDIVR